jgi:hypothetical protein
MTTKNATKNIARKTAQATPPTLAEQVKVKPAKALAIKVRDKALHALVAKSLAACLNAAKAGVTEYQAFAAVVKAAPLNDAPSMIALCTDIRETYGDDHADAAQIRINVLNNARKVAHGGSKDKHAVGGRGRGAMLEALESVTSIRELKKAMAAAKPEGLKDARGGDTKSADKGKGKGAKAATKAVKAASVPKTRTEAIAAAIQVLEFVEKHFLLAGSDAGTIGAVDSAIASLAACLKKAA